MLDKFFFQPDTLPRFSQFVIVGNTPLSFDESGVMAFNMAEPPGAQGLPVGEAIEWLAPLPLDDLDPCVEYWSIATKLALDLLARGHLRPGVGSNHYDMWRMSLPSQDERIAQLASGCPLEAATSVDDGARFYQAQFTLGRYFDAVADVLVRTPGASRMVSQPIYAGEDRYSISADVAVADNEPHCVLGFRLEPPPADGEFFLVPYVQSRHDPSLAVDAQAVWGAEAAVVARLGDDIEEVMLRSLRRAGQVWPPLRKILEQSRPDRLELSELEVEQFLTEAAALLRTNGFEVSLPTEMTAGSLQLRARLHSPRMASAAGSAFDLTQLLALKWEAALDGEALTAAELKQLADAKRPLLKLRGRWVVIDESTAKKVGSKTARSPKKVTAGAALSAAVSGNMEIDGETVDVEVDSAVSDIAARLANFERSAELMEPDGLTAELRPYQRRGLAWLAEMCELRLGGCLADDMGLGKTVQLIALHLHRRQGPTLVICPASLLGNWEREVAKFAPGIVTHRFHGASRKLDALGKTDIVLATYGVVRRDHAMLNDIGWDMVVADEAQHAKNPQSQTAKSIRAVKANVRLALTGTPVENQLTELWSLLDWTTPGLLGPLETFRRNIATPIERFHDEQATAELSKIVRPFLLRRRKVDPDIAPDLPPKTESDVFVTLTVEQASLYKAVTDEALENIKSSTGVERKGLILKLLTALKQVCNHPAQFLRQSQPLASRSGKLAALDELLDGLHGTQESVLVFSQYVQMGRLLENHLAEKGIGTLFLHGGVEPRRRDEMVERFQAGVAPVFLLSLKAGGTGLNLTRATHVIHFDRWWNPAVEDQATDRAYRIGQTQPVQVHRLISEGTLEERIAQILESKRHLSESVIGAGETWVSELDDSELAALVALEPAR